MAQTNESGSLVTMEGTKLKLTPGLNISNPSVRVVSIVGKARMGKSTFLNAFVSKCSKENKVVFTTNSGVKHCTFGINYYFIPEHNILLLDSQGLANGDARHDPALLLFIYLVSNVVIFNDSKILQNEALKLLEPICTFATYINDFDSFVKPALIFRLSDGKLVENTDENLQQVMEHHPDQYQSIRESIEEVFQTPIQLVKTESLDRSDERLLDANDYLGLLKETENGFDKTISYIMDIVNKSEPRMNILSRLPEIVEQINNNEKISLEKLDVVGLVHKNDLLEWLQTVSPHLKTPIEVDGTQHDYLNKVVKRQQEVDAKLKEFDKRFKSVSGNIKREQKKKLKAELDAPIAKATNDSEQLSHKKVKSRVEGLNEYAFSLDSKSSSFIKMDQKLLKSGRLNNFMLLKDACVSMYSPVKTYYDSWVSTISDDFTKCIQECRTKELEERAALVKYTNAAIDNYESYCREKIETLEADKNMLLPNSKLIESWKNSQKESVVAYIQANINIRTASLTMKEKRLSYSIVSERLTNINHDLVCDIYNDFLHQLIHGVDESKNIDSALTEKKETLLYNKLFINPGYGKIIYDNNPDIELVHDAFLLNIIVRDIDETISKGKMPYMTMRTWALIYESLYTDAMAVLIKDGVCSPDSSYLTFISKDEDTERGLTIVEGPCNSEVYDNHVSELLRLEMKKIYCRGIVSKSIVSETRIMSTF